MRVSAAILVGALLVGMAGCSSETEQRSAAAPPAPSAEPSPNLEPQVTTAPEPEPSDPTPEPAQTGTALAVLATLTVKGRAAQTGYDRDRFGQAWADVDRNGCDTRNDMLRRDLTGVVYKPGTRDCVVFTGRLASDPYTGAEIDFERGGANEVDIDHVVALSNAWVTGAFGWDERKRIAFGNDPANLLAVDSSANRRKGAADAATWLPGVRSYWCSYVARQVSVKAKYDLWVTPAERDATQRVLSNCPDQSALDAGQLQLPPAGLGAAYSPPAPAPKPTSQADGTDPRFPFCKDAVAAGYGPYVSGKDPEYEWYRDGDGDGSVCE